MRNWKKLFWYYGSITFYAVGYLLVFCDWLLGPENIAPFLDCMVLAIFSELFGVVNAIYLCPMVRGRDMPAPIRPATVKVLNPQGTILGWAVLFLHNHRVPAGPYLYAAILSWTISAFFVVMLLRPVATDMGIMYALRALTIGIFVRDNKLTGQTWFTFGLCTFLVYFRAYMEHRAVVATAAAAEGGVDGAAAAVAAERARAVDHAAIEHSRTAQLIAAAAVTSEHARAGERAAAERAMAVDHAAAERARIALHARTAQLIATERATVAVTAEHAKAVERAAAEAATAVVAAEHAGTSAKSVASVD